jgi:hypothetical protein
MREGRLLLGGEALEPDRRERAHRVTASIFPHPTTPHPSPTHRPPPTRHAHHRHGDARPPTHQNTIITDITLYTQSKSARPPTEIPIERRRTLGWKPTRSTASQASCLRHSARVGKHVSATIFFRVALV